MQRVGPMTTALDTPALSTADLREPGRRAPAKPVLMRELIGESLREARVGQGKTLREISQEARVSLGYLSEVERGQKEASSELLAAICGALNAPLSEILNLVSEKMALYERVTSLPTIRPVAQAAA